MRCLDLKLNISKKTYCMCYFRFILLPSSRIDTGDDNRVSKEEFTSSSVKAAVEKWVGEIEDMDAEFDKIDANGGGQILFNEFVDWALEKNLDIEDDVE